MGMFILRRLMIMIFTALCLTFVVFFLINLYLNLEKLAKIQGNFRMSDEAVQSYLLNNGYLLPVPVKYGQWLGALPGHVIEGMDGEVCSRCISSEILLSDAPKYCGVL